MTQQMQDVSTLLGAAPSPQDVASLLGPDQSQQNPIAHEAGLLSGSALGGVASGLGIPGDIQALLDKYAFGVDPSTDSKRLPTSSEIRAATTDKLGMTGTEATFQPTNRGEQMAASVAGGLGAAIPALATGGAVLPTLVAGGTGGFGAELGHELMPDSALAPVIGGMAGGLGGGGLGGGLESLANSGAVSRIASKLGNSTSLQSAGEALQAAGRDWVGKVPDRIDAIFKGLDRTDPAAVTKANSDAQKLLDFAKGPLAKIIKTKSPSASDPLPETVARQLLAGGRNGSSTLDALRAEMPDAVDELAAAHLSTSPSGWSKFPDSTKSALVADAKVRSKLDSALPVPSARPANPLLPFAESGAGGFGLSYLGGLISHMGGHSFELGRDLGGALGASAPLAWHYARHLSEHPELLRNPLIGGAASQP